MRARWLTLLVAVYVSLDVGNPFMPGALTFGVESSIEVRQADRFRAHHDDAAGGRSLTPAPRRLERVTSRETLTRAPAHDVRVWHRPVRHVRVSLPAPSLAPEDH